MEFGVVHSQSNPQETELALLPQNVQQTEEPQEDATASLRRIFLGSLLEDHERALATKNLKPDEFCDNEIKTSKYTLNPVSIHFIVWKNLFEQFHRAANLYFLFIAILQMVPGVSPTGRFTTIIPLTFVMSASLAKDAYEDYRRHCLDKELNFKQARVFRRGSWMKVNWRDVAVGDILEVKKGESFPADAVMIYSSEPEGLCYIETSSLDGETNLKIRKSCSAAYRVFDASNPQQFSAKLCCELPNNRLYNFDGNISLQGSMVPLTNECILLRGAALRNTATAYGIVIFTGQETKLMKNSSQKDHKMSNMDHTTNRQVLFIFLSQLCLAGACAIGLGIFTVYLESHWYLATNTENAATSALVGFLTFLILYNNLIPISLYVSMEMVKLVQAVLINNDTEMYHEASDTPALARTSALNEELGQVSYIFSDKTGTLTCNIMEFTKFSCVTEAGQAVCYGSGVTEIAKAAAMREGRILKDDRPAGFVAKDGFAFWDDRVNGMQWRKEPNAPQIEDFLRHLALCHTVVAEQDERHSGVAIYQAASPDESCLVKGARELGVVFEDRTESTVTIRIAGEKFVYELLNIIEFDSTRKRMSVILRAPDKSLLLLCKGADSVIYPRLAHGSQDALLSNTLEMLTKFAADGLRTLVIAKTTLEEASYAEWAQRYDAASCSLTDRAEKMAAVGEEVEKNLTLVGTTAIEDKLQDSVPQTIELLMAAGIKVWVLTGDKQETAINIGYACALLNNMMILFSFDEHEKAENLGERIRCFVNDADENMKCAKPSDMALVVQGGLLEHVLNDDSVAKLFLRLATQCKSVICCRVSPLQKALIVQLVKKNIASITLAIGDGANDVPMIQSANVGIGISGMEGLQAARASDYSIAQFKFLKRLLLVHGRWSYRRIARLILYSFYKNIGLYLTQCWFCLLNAFSGMSLYDPWSLAVFNVMFTAFPIMVMAVLDRDCEACRTLSMDQFPELFRDGLTSRLFNTKTFWFYAGNAIYHSLLAFYVTLLCLRDTYVVDSGQALEVSSLGMTCYTVVLAIVTVKVAFETLSWTGINCFFVVGSFAVWFVFLAIYCNFYSWMKVDDFANWYGVAQVVLAQPCFYLVCLVVTAIASLRDFIYKYYRRNFNPELSHVIQIFETTKSGNFVRSDVAEHYSYLMAQLETNEPKFGSMSAAPSMMFRTGFAFSQEGGQADITKVIARTITKLRIIRALRPKQSGSQVRSPVREHGSPTTPTTVATEDLKKIPPPSPS